MEIKTERKPITFARRKIKIGKHKKIKGADVLIAIISLLILQMKAGFSVKLVECMS
jgi:hypothetical protein